MIRLKPTDLRAIFLALTFAPSLLTGAEVSVFYPVNATFYRLLAPDGSERMFERSVFDRSHLFGEGDWEGKLLGQEATLTSDDLKQPNKGTFYTFRRGLLAEWTQDGQPQPVPPAHTQALSQLERYPTKAEIEALVDKARAQSDIWDGSGRLRVLSKNPNVTSLCAGLLVLIFVGLALGCASVWARILCGGLAAAFLAGVFATGSRSGFLAVGTGLAVELGFVAIRHLRPLRLLSALLVCGLVGGLFLTFGPARFTRELLKSDELRSDIHRTFPAMLADSPAGVGFGNSGATYDVWYRNPEIKRTVRTLVGSHQTLLLELPNALRVLYLSGWALLFAWLWAIALKTQHTVPLALATAVFVAGFFNPIFESALTYLVPGLGLVEAVGISVRHQHMLFSRKGVLLTVFACLLLGGGLVAALCGLGQRSRASVRLSVSPKAVCVADERPHTWVVNDEFALGGWLYTGQEVLGYYADHAEASGLALTDSLDALPAKVERLVLAGRSVEAYLQRWKDPQRRVTLCKPQALLLLSPSVNPASLPRDLVSVVRLRAVVGSLAAPGLGLTPDALPLGTRLAPGALVYIPGWVTLALTF